MHTYIHKGCIQNTYISGISGKVVAIGLQYKQKVLCLKKKINTLQVPLFEDFQIESIQVIKITSHTKEQ